MASKKSSTSTRELPARDPKERFKGLATKRVTVAIRQLRLIGNLANRKNYSYEPDDARKIVKALQRELDDLKSRFKGENNSDNSIFSL